MEGLNILEVIQRFDHVSQRDISRETGLSLGMVNMLIKKFLKVGLLKAERLNGNNIKYILTPKGSQLLFEKTITYVKRSYLAVQKISSHVEIVLRQEFEDVDCIPIVGTHGEVYAVVEDVARRLGKQVKFSEENKKDEKVLYLDRASDTYGVNVFDGIEISE